MKTKLTTFLSIYITGFVIAGFMLLAFPKGAFVVFINKHHTPFLDVFFKNMTYLGDGSIFLVLLGLFWIFKQRYHKELIFTAFMQTLIVTFFKRILFAGEPRPKALLSDTFSLHFVSDVPVHLSNSFPSGHTATAFSIAMLLALTLFKAKPLGQIFTFLLAFIAAYSRIYLIQHFFIDVWFGSLIGISSAMFSVWIIQNYSMIRNNIQIQRNQKRNPIPSYRIMLPFIKGNKYFSKLTN